MNFRRDHIGLKRTCLASALALVYAQPSFALQEMSEDSLSEATGAGVALVLDDFKMVFQGPNDLSAGSSYARGLENPSQLDTGFIHIIPTGENYQKLGQNVYSKVYSSTYDTAYLNERGRLYTGVYEQKYEERYNSYYNDPAKRSAIQTSVTTDYSAAFRTRTVQEIFNTPLMQSYLAQRKEDYKDGVTWPWEVIDDGTDDNTSGTRNNEEKSLAQAIKNTYEMIEILFGNRSSETLTSEFRNSDFYKNVYLKSAEYQKYGRKNLVSEEVNKLIAQLVEDTLKNEADQNAGEYAKGESDKAHAIVLANAERIAKEAASKATVGGLRTKADVFIYGLALSKSDGSLSTRYSNKGFNWGTADNPWLFRAGTETVKQFKDKAEDVGYLALEAPLAKTALEDPANTENSAFNIKLGLWSDIFSRELNSSREVNPITGAPVSGLDKDYRLRTQFIANGLSLNGSQVRMFQTLESSNSDHNQTFGMASLIRLNTNDNPANLSINDTNLDSKGIRLSTATEDDLDDLSLGQVATPAMQRGALAPIFNEKEGLYLYSPNINLVLGNMYQPFVVGSEGNNIILEVTRIPNIPSIYNQIYQNYGGGLGTADLKGSTCNVNSCGTPITIQGTSYQGRNATHSSISIGTTERLSNNMLKAKDGATATGVVFKDVNGGVKNFGSAVIDGVLIQHLKIKTTGL